MSKILFLNETDRNASYKTEYRYKTAKPVKAAKPKRDEAGFIIPYAVFRPIREPGLICELLGDTPVRRSADLKMNLDYLMKEAYEHAIEQIMCSVRLQEVRCQMQFNMEDRAWEHYTRLREKGQYAVMPSVTVEERRRVILGAITWKYDWIQKHKKWCFQFADAVITREKNGGTESWSQSQFIEKFIRVADSLPEANRRLLDQLYETAWEIKLYYDYGICGFLSYGNTAYGGYVHRRPELLMNIDRLLKTDLADKWEDTHQPYEVIAHIGAKMVVCDGDERCDDQRKVMEYLMKAYWCAFSDNENIVLLRSEVEVPPENIWKVRPFEAWK